MDILKDIVQVLVTTALLWAERPPSYLLQSPTPTQPFEISIPTVTVYTPSRCLPLPSYSSMPGASAANAQILTQILVLFFGLSIFGFFSLGLGALCLSIHETQASPRLRTSPPSEASPTVEVAIDSLAEAEAMPEVVHLKTIQELSVKIQNLEGQITGKAAEISSLEFYHELQLASIWSDFESQKSHWAAAQTALKVEGQTTVADLRAKIARLEQQVDSHNAIVEQVNADRQTELETARSAHHSAIQTLTARHETETTSLTNDLVEAQALATRLQTDLNQALKETQLLESSKARLNQLQSSQSTTIFKLKAQLEETSNQLKNANQEKATVQDRLAAAEADVKSIGTRLHDAVKEHTAVVRQKDDKITKNSATMNTLRSELAQQRGQWARFAPQMHRLNAEITTKDAEISMLKSSLSSATSRIAASELEARNVSTISASADAVTQPDVFNNEDAHTEVNAEDAMSASSGSVSTAGSLTRSQSMTSLGLTSSSGSPRRRHSVDVIIESAKQVLEEAAVATRTENLEVGVAAEEAMVEQVRAQSAGADSPEPSRTSLNESETVEPEQRLSASMWATSRPPVKNVPPPRPDWGNEAAAARKGRNGVKSHRNAAQPKGQRQRPRRDDDQGSMSFSTSERIASGRAGS
ncbi:hypothetical protein FRC00_002831 [Tulasnella sp. 408]|nr:hypothetical protein FRC00_002831 [Tulasnella sp. 408]